MGGCAISFMSAVASAKTVENEFITRVRTMGPQSVEIGDNTGLPESKVRRAPASVHRDYDELFKEYYGGQHGTLTVLLHERIQQYAKNTAMMYRPIDKISKEDMTDEKTGKTKTWEYIYLKPTCKITYEEMWQKMTAFGHGLLSLGIAPGAKIGLYEDTRYEWLVACYGMWTQGMVGVTVYANLGDEALIYAIKESELPAILTNGKLVKNLISLCRKHSVRLPILIVTDDVPPTVDTTGVTIARFDDLVSSNITQPTPPLKSDPADVALIMYTSGTTGDPKGVMMTHGNVYAAVRCLTLRLEQIIGEAGVAEDEEQHVHLAYLPLAHILEFAAENVLLMRGAILGYGNPRTLTDLSARPHGDLREYRPTFLAGVPRVFDTIKKAVEGKLPPPGSFKRRVFDRAFQERKEALEKGYDTPYWNDKVFANPRALLGGRCRMLISGGAPLSGHTYEFLSIVFCCAVAQGYGLTETCANATIQQYYDLQKDNVGGPLPAVEIKLRDVDTWKHTDQPHPRGEVLVRGPIVTKGYYRQPEKTREAFLDGGWFATGDVGQFMPDGTLKIVGRTKALAKNAHGEYIALESLESTYVLNELVMPNGVCVLVDSNESFICALVLTDEQKAMKFAEANGIQGSWPTILDAPAFRSAAIASLVATAKHTGRKPFEFVKNVRVLHDEWTPENGILTAAMKLRRKEIDTKYAAQIKEMFTESA